MKRIWKILIAVGIVLLLFLGLGVGLIFWGVTAMQTIAQEVYGGPFSKSILPIIGVNLPPNKIAVFGTQTGVITLMIQSPPSSLKNTLPLSDADPKAAFEHYRVRPDVQSLHLSTTFAGVETAVPTAFRVGPQIIHTLLFTSPDGKKATITILNLKHQQDLIMVISPAADTVLQDTGLFVSDLPMLQQ